MSTLGVSESLVKELIANCNSKLFPDFETQTNNLNDENNLINDNIMLTTNNSPTTHMMIFGFGSNCIGRFSIVGVYEFSNQKLRCEKKYMLSKGNFVDISFLS